MIYENGALLAETERFPLGDEYAVADVDLDLLRQERQRMGTFDDNRRTHRARTADFRPVSFELAPPLTDLGLRLRLERFPFVLDRRGTPRAGLLRGVQHPGRGPPAAARRDRRPEGGHRGLRRPRLHARADRRGPCDGPRGAAAQRHPGVDAARFRDQRPHQGQRARADAGDRRHGGGAGHHADRPPDAQGDEPPLRLRRAGLRRHLRERPSRPAHRLLVPPRQPAQRHRPRHRRPLRAGARLVHVRRRRPDEPLQRQLRRPQDPHPAPHPLGRQQRPVRRGDRQDPHRDPRHGDQPRAGTGRGDAVHGVEDRPIRPARLHPVPRPPLRLPPIEDRLPRLARLARGGGGGVAAGIPEAKRVAYDLPEIRRWLEVFCRRFFGFAQFKRSAMPNGPKVSAGGSLSPRGIGGHRRMGRLRLGWPNWRGSTRTWPSPETVARNGGIGPISAEPDRASPSGRGSGTD